MQIRSNVLAAAVSLSLLASGGVLAQEPPTDSPPPQSTDEASAAPSTPQDAQTAPAQSAPTQDTTTSTAAAEVVSDEKVEQFANAYMEVQTIQQKATADLGTTTDPAAADKVKSTAQTDMIAAVERNGLNVEEFNQFVQSMASNAELRDRVAAKLQERTGG